MSESKIDMFIDTLHRIHRQRHKISKPSNGYAAKHTVPDNISPNITTVNTITPISFQTAGSRKLHAHLASRRRITCRNSRNHFKPNQTVSTSTRISRIEDGNTQTKLENLVRSYFCPS